jgi:glycosyltransferase involved in cell wall biosynthesis
MDRFALLSARLEGDVLQPVWFETPAEVEAVFGPGSYPVHTVGKFRYHWHLGSPVRGIRQRLRTFRFYLRKGREIYRERPFDCIVAYSHMTTGVMAGILKWFTGSKLIIEVVTSPEHVYITNRARPRLHERGMKFYSDVCLHLSLSMADRAHLLFSNQLQAYRAFRKIPRSVFHEFVPVSLMSKPEQRETREQYVLLVGAPWYLKGADVLIRAFLEVSPEFPAVRLRILGHYPDKAEMEAMTCGSDRIEIMKARPPTEALEVIGQASVFVLPSRCEGLARVLLEAMAAGVPVVGSIVGGTPALVRDGENGFLFPVGDHKALAERLRRLLGDEQLRSRMGVAGYARAHGELNEDCYVREFARMIHATASGQDTL